MIDFINKETTINFNYDLKFNSQFRKYDKESKFTIIRQTKGGLYILRDEDGIEVVLLKRNIEYF